jgi:hypothetical protein
LLGTAHKHAHSVAEILCIGDELPPQWPQKRGAKAAAFVFNPFAGCIVLPTSVVLNLFQHLNFGPEAVLEDWVIGLGL